ncbi:MAG TPA: hypothetical protein VNW46_01880 [Gemmatimonadaceae bacterium]|nr:hypothetical protein [Gemmatimonadaceae bacterium]
MTPSALRVVLVTAVVAAAAACSDNATSPTSPPTVSLTLSSHTVTHGDSITVSATGKQSQGFLLDLILTESFDTVTTVGSGGSGSTVVSLTRRYAVPDSVGMYIRFRASAVPAATNLPTATVVDSALVQ